MNPQQNHAAGEQVQPAQQPNRPNANAQPAVDADMKATVKHIQGVFDRWPEDWREQAVEKYGAHTTSIISDLRITIASANRVTKANKFAKHVATARHQLRSVLDQHPNLVLETIKWRGMLVPKPAAPKVAARPAQGPVLVANPNVAQKGGGVMDAHFIQHQANRVEPAVVKRAIDAPIVRKDKPVAPVAVPAAQPVKDVPVVPAPAAAPAKLNSRQRRNAARLAGLKARAKAALPAPVGDAAAVAPVVPAVKAVPVVAQEAKAHPPQAAEVKQEVPQPVVPANAPAAPVAPVAGPAKMSRKQRKLAARALAAAQPKAAAAKLDLAAKPVAPAAKAVGAAGPANEVAPPPKAEGKKGQGRGKAQVPAAAAVKATDEAVPAADAKAPAGPKPPPKDAVYSRVLKHNLPSNFMSTVHDGVTHLRQEGVECCSGKATVLWADDRPGYTQAGRYATVLNSYLPVIKAASQNLRDRVCAFNFDFPVTRSLTGENPHALSAAVRSLFTARALARLSHDCTKIVSCYASQRELNIHLHAIPLVKGPVPTLALYMPNVTADDLKRRATISDANYITDLVLGDGLLFVDVYHLGPEALTQSNLYRYMVRAGASRAVWIGHRYTGHFGSTFNEGVWALTQPGTVTSYPDMESPAYPAHPSLDWIWHEQGDQLSWTIVTSSSTYTMVEFIRCHTVAGNMHRAIEPDYHTVSVIKTGNVLTHAATVFVLRHVPLGRHLVQKMQVHVPTKIWSVIEQHFAQRPISQYTLSSATHASSNIATMIPLWKELSLKFPGLVTSAMEDYTRAYLESTTIDRARRWDVTYNTCNAAAAHLNQTRQNFGATQDRTWKPAIGFMLMLVLLGMLGPKVVRFLVRIIRIQPYSKWSIFPNSPTFSACLEELVRHFFGTMTLGGLEIAAGCARIGAYCRSWRTRPYAVTELLRTLDATAGHLALSGMPLSQALPIHMVANGLDIPGVGVCCLAVTGLKRVYSALTAIVPSPEVEHLAEFHERVNDGDVIQESFGLQPETGSQIKVETPRRPAPAGIKPIEAGVVTVNGEVLDATTTVNPLPSRNDCPPWFNIIHLSVPFYAPANGPAELLSMITSRITVLPKFQRTDSQRLAVATLWRNQQSKAITEEIWGDARSHGTHIFKNAVQMVMMRTDCAVPGFELLLAHWFDDLPASKKKAYKQSLELLAKGREPPRSTKLMIKADEVLCKSAEDGSIEFKPRPIAVVDPMVVVRTGPYIKWATEKLKDIYFDYSTPTVLLKTNATKYPNRPKEFSITCNFACGWDADDLNAWMRFVLLADCSNRAHWWIIASGDDSLVVYKYREDTLFLEADASKYDRSQTAGLLDHEYSILSAMNVPQEITDLLRKTASQPYRCVYRDTEIVVTREAFRDTGGADTTFGNTANMLAAWTAVAASIQYSPTRVEIMSGFERLGLEMKLDIHLCVEDATFLKGRWWKLQHENLDNITHAWGPLESRLVKIVKSMRAPWTMGVKASRVQCMEAFLSCQALSLSNFTTGPILTHFIQMWRTRAHNQEMKFAIDVNERRVHHKVGAGKTVYIPDDEAAFAHLADRYDITEADLKEFYETFPESCPARWSGRLATALAQRDYA